MKKQINLPKPDERIFITDYISLCFQQVCVLPEVTDEEILAFANLHSPAGTSNGWVKVVNDPKEHTGLDASCGPGPCNDCPGRIHKLIEC